MRKRTMGTEVEMGRRPIIEAGQSFSTMVIGMFRAAPFSKVMLDHVNRCLMISSNVGANLTMPSSLFWKNQTRFYLDSGTHPEYAGPECLSGVDVATWEKSGERNLRDIALKLSSEEITALVKDRVSASDIYAFRAYIAKFGGFTFLKNNRAHGLSASWGKHLSILAERGRVTFERLGVALAPFISTSYIWGGNGFFESSSVAGKPAYYLSQRAEVMEDYMNGSTTSGRPLINTRDEPHADINKYLRIHLIPFDSHMSETVIWLEAELMSLLVEMVEEGFFEPGVSWIHDHYRETGKVLKIEFLDICRKVNRDLTLRQEVHLGGKFIRPLYVQMHYLKLMRRYERLGGLSPEQKKAVDRFAGLLETMEIASKTDEPEEHLSGVVDWAAKLCILKRVTQKAGRNIFEVKLEDKISVIRHGQPKEEDLLPHLEFLDDDFHDVRDSGGHNRLERAGLRERILSEDRIAHAKHNAPADTRAAVRAFYEKVMLENRLRMLAFDWDHLSATPTDKTPGGLYEYGFRIELNDPFLTDPAHVDLSAS